MSKKAIVEQITGSAIYRRAQYVVDHPECLICKFFGLVTTTGLQVHHIAGRGPLPAYEEPLNWIVLCDQHHRKIQGLDKATKLMLALKYEYDRKNVSPAAVYRLRGWDDYFAERDTAELLCVLSVMAIALE